MSHGRQLAALGGTPAFSAPLHVGRPNIGDRARLMSRLEDMIESRHLTNGGPYMLEFERRVALTVGAAHCVMMANATVALELTIRALGLTGEVIVPAFTFVATAHAVTWNGLTPVFCDVDPNTYTLDPVEVERLITPRTSAIIGVHVFGVPCDVVALEALAERHGLMVLYDAAHAFGCSRDGVPIGRFGRAEVFSFHATKFVNSAEGGAVVTNDGDLAERLRLARNFGFSTYDHVITVGTNAKMSEPCAAIGLTNLESMSRFLAVNRHNYERYRDGLEHVPGIRLARIEPADSRNFQYVVLEVDPEEAGLTRDELQRVLWAENVLARRYFYPGCHRLEPYRSRRPPDSWNLVNTERIATRALCLPTGTQMDPADIDTVCEIIEAAGALAPSIRLAAGTQAAVAATT